MPVPFQMCNEFLPWGMLHLNQLHLIVAQLHVVELRTGNIKACVKPFLKCKAQIK